MSVDEVHPLGASIDMDPDAEQIQQHWMGVEQLSEPSGRRKSEIANRESDEQGVRPVARLLASPEAQIT